MRELGPVDINEVELERFKMRAQSYIDAKLTRFAEPADADVILDWTCDNIIVMVTQLVWGREVQRQECRWPADWWQAFKDRWFPIWAKKRWPVRYHTEIMTARELYPQVVLPSDRYKAVIAVDKSRQW